MAEPDLKSWNIAFWLLLLWSIHPLRVDCVRLIEDDDSADRFGSRLWSEDLPVWVEKTDAFPIKTSGYYNKGQYSLLEMPSPMDLRAARNMQLRENHQVWRLLRTLHGEPVLYYESDSVHEPVASPYRLSKRIITDGMQTTSGYRAFMKWQPIVIGLVCSVFVVVVVVGTTIYYMRARQIRKRNAEMEDEFESVLQAKHSPMGSLLGTSSVANIEGDRKLAHSAQMYHYQHQKQQMLAVERAMENAHSSEDGSSSDVEEGDFTVYECPGLAETEKLEIENPLYIGGTAEQGPSSGELINASDVEEGSDSTPTAKCKDQP